MTSGGAVSVSSGEPLVLLAAGGTGGHLFPAAALAIELKARGRAVALVTDRRGQGFGERFDKSLATVPVFGIAAASPTGNPFKKAVAAVQLLRGLMQSRRLVRAQRPSVTVGFGGYPSVPPLLSAASQGLPVVIHEQNALVGRANRIIAARAVRIATSFEKVGLLPARLSARVALVGNPIRGPIARLHGEPYRSPGKKGAFRILVTGGSQGAAVFSTTVPAAVALLKADRRRRLSISQQCRAEDLDAARQAYDRIGVDATLKPFFDDVPERLARAHLVICRSGASTVAELACAGRPAILAPYPHAADDHQTENARALADKGAAWLMPEKADGDAAFDAENLAQKLDALLSEPSVLEGAARKAAALARPDAASRLADLVESLLPSRTEG